MKRSIKVLLALLLIFIAVQFIPRDQNESGNAVNDMTKIVAVPGNVQAILKRSCYDCHSNRTNYPWYAQIQPVRFMLDGHIRDGKAALNFNEFGKYSSRKQRSKLRAVGQSLEEGSMPISSYTFIHRSAVLSKDEKARLMNWVKTISDNLLQKN